ncbi:MULTISPECIES: YtxH domain-containing protein [Bacillaceae]|uniref:General stress protein n=1 Tax=Domibacillus aminovorans TaxID=29332 RepID=A0A177KT39_9BACI|nr:MULTISPECIES: YtxH domain-containing protein [Bacillaceae]OAH56246.1 hypothetical protein AWH48_06145 [Domibacillus aminovorans]
MRNNNTYDQFNIKKNDATAPQQTQYENLDLNTDRYNYNDSINTKDFIIGALCGAFIGATTALMVAPKSGRELRDDLNVQAGSLKERASSLTDTAKDKTSTLTKTVQEQSTAIVDKVKSLKPSGSSTNSETAEGKKEEAKSVVENVLDAVTDKVDTTADTAKTKLDEAKKAFDKVEESTNSPSVTGNSSKPASEAPANPADKGINEKKNDGFSSNTNNNMNKKTYNK